MSVKAVRKYYDQICEQYHEMIELIHDLEKEAEQDLVEPERIERLKEQVAPIKQNYERWTYMMFLLNQPERKSKHERYKRQNSRFLQNLDKQNDLDSVLEENKASLAQVGK